MGPAIGINGPLRRCAPEHDPVPSGRPLMRVEVRPDPRMDSIRADQRITGDLDALTRVRAVEGGDHPVASILKIHQPAIGMNARRSQPLKYSAQQHAMKPATMDAELRHGVTGIDPTQFLPHGLTEPIDVDELARADAHSIQSGQQAERCEFLYGVRQHIDADAKLTQFERLLVNLCVDAQIVQGKSRRETANTTSSDDYLHATFPKRRLQGLRSLSGAAADRSSRQRA